MFDFRPNQYQQVLKLKFTGLLNIPLCYFGICLSRYHTVAVMPWLFPKRLFKCLKRKGNFQGVTKLFLGASVMILCTTKIFKSVLKSLLGRVEKYLWYKLYILKCFNYLKQDKKSEIFFQDPRSEIFFLFIFENIFFFFFFLV